MRPFRTSLALLSVMALVASPAMVAPAAAQSGGIPTDDHLFTYGRIPGDFDALVAAAGGSVVRRHDAIGVAVTSGLSDAAAASIAGDNPVARDYVVRWQRPLAAVGSGIIRVTNPSGAAHDPTAASLFGIQWDMRIIDADDAWNAGFSGNPNVLVAVLDTGIDPFHQDLQGLVDFATSVAFTPSLTGPPAWVDDRYHGTHVAGSIVTNGIGTSGVAPHTRLMAVKVLNVNGGGSFGNVIAGIMHAADNGADIINMSLAVPGGLSKSLPGVDTLNAAANFAVNYANRRGVLVVSAAGNDAIDMQHAGDLLFTPCDNGAGICVSATGPSDELAGYSNYGVSSVNVAAPGGNFDGVSAATSVVLSPCSSRSALAVLAACSSGDVYLFLQGTSMAAPHVSGAAALLDAQANGAMRSGRLKTRLQQTADDLGPKGADPAYGKGRINVCTLVGCR